MRRSPLLLLVLAVVGCADADSSRETTTVVASTTAPAARDTVSNVVASAIDVLAAGDEAVALLGDGEVVSADADTFSYLIQLRLDDGSVVIAHLDSAFGLVTVEPDENGIRNEDELPQRIDLVTARDVALEAAGGGIAVGVEAEDYGYDIDVLLDDGSTFEVHLDDAHQAIRTEVNG